MMRYSAVQKVIFFSFTFLLSGCIYENPEEPPVVTNTMYETKIAFQCLQGSVDIFKQEITENATLTTPGRTISLYVYDKSTGNLVKEQTILKNALRQFQGVTLSLASGEYEIRCWGNVNAQTTFYGEDKLNTARLTNVKNYPDQRTVVSDDPLYFGATSLVVPKDGFSSGVIADTIFFKTAHLHVSVAFTGNTSIIPKVEIRNLIPAFDFEMKAIDNNKISYFPEVKKQNSLLKTELNILRTAYKQGNISYDHTKYLEITVKDPIADTLIYTVNLEQWMKSKGITLHPQNDNNILSIPDSLSAITTGVASLPPIRIELPNSIPSNPPDTTTTPPIDTIPVTPPIPDINEQGLFFHVYFNDDNASNDIFNQVIESVNMYIYEKYSGIRVPISHDVLSKIDLSTFPGLRLSLPPINSTNKDPREYEIRCWANVSTNSQIKNEQYASTAELSNANISTSDTIRTNDELYFGQASVKVTSDYRYVTEAINFKSAYTRFTISVKGMATIPKIRVSGLSSSYDFKMNSTQLTYIDYYPEVTSKSATETTFIFNSMRLTNQSKDNVKITLLDTNGTVIHEVPLKGKEIWINDNSNYRYIYIKGTPTVNRIGITINVEENGISNEIW